MILKTTQQPSSMLAVMILLTVAATAQEITTPQVQVPAQVSSQPAPASSTPTVAPMTSDQLDALVAPIALYPDALVAQVLGAAAAPDQVAIADYWLGQNKTITGTALAQAVDAQTWDPSVKALTQFPSVLNVLFLRLFVVDIL
jgi:Protein of unknown function (DUF3300)